MIPNDIDTQAPMISLYSAVVEAPGLLPVERGVFNLFVADDVPGRKRMLYRLFFRNGVGHPLTLSGFKVVRERSGVHV